MTAMTSIRTLLLVGALVVTAGCSGFGGGGGGAPTPNSTATDAVDGSAVGPGANETSTTTHGHGEAGTPAGNATAGATGRMAVVVDGKRLNLSRAIAGTRSFSVVGDTWRASGDPPTLGAVLSVAGLDARATSLSYNGETYDERRPGTKLVYRVDGEPVNPAEYELEDGDEVWVLVLTDETNASTPGDYIPPERLHVHGSMEFVVNGESLNFSRDKWQAANHNNHFHFEGGHSDPWHAHSWSVTLAYALSTLEDINASEAGITYNGTTYADDEAGTTVRITVNGEPVDPTSYYLKDGDEVRIEITRED